MTFDVDVVKELPFFTAAAFFKKIEFPLLSP